MPSECTPYLPDDLSLPIFYSSNGDPSKVLYWNEISGHDWEIPCKGGDYCGKKRSRQTQKPVIATPNSKLLQSSCEVSTWRNYNLMSMCKWIARFPSLIRYGANLHKIYTILSADPKTAIPYLDIAEIEANYFSCYNLDLPLNRTANEKLKERYQGILKSNSVCSVQTCWPNSPHAFCKMFKFLYFRDT